MKKVILIALLFFGCSEKEVKFPFSNLSVDDAVALENDKVIFLDFYSDT